MRNTRTCRTNTSAGSRLLRSSATLSAAALVATAFVATAGTAGAVVRAGGGTNAEGTPTYFADSAGVALKLCANAGAKCDPVTAPDIGSYFTAEANVGALQGLWNVNAFFGEDAAGNPTKVPETGNSALFRADGLVPNRRYTIKDPWATHTCVTDAKGQLGNKNCMFETGGHAGGTMAAGPVKSFLRAVGAARGFVGNLASGRQVTGSTTGFNKLSITGPRVNLSTKSFVIGGQMAANTAMSQVNTAPLSMGNRNSAATVVRTIRYTSFGTRAATPRVTKSGANPGAFAVTNACGAVASGSACNIKVSYTPKPNRSVSAILTIDDNGLAAPRRVKLTGTGPDTLAPKVEARTPDRAVTGVALSKSVSVKYSEVVRGLRGNFTLVNNSNGNRVGATVTRVGQTNRFVLNPRKALKADTGYTVALNGGRQAIRDLSNNSARDMNWRFHTR